MVEKYKMTATEFFGLPETNLPTELIDGEVTVTPAPVPLHQLINGEFYALIKSLAPDGKVYYSPIDVYLDDENVVQPDIVWVSAGSRCVVGEKYLAGPPDLVIEILSPGTERRDRQAKFNPYQKFGVREYWLVHPLEQYVEVWRLEHGVFVHQGIYAPDETFESAALDEKAVELKKMFDGGESYANKTNTLME